MPVTLSSQREDVRARLNETESQASTGFYVDSDLNNWINEGCRDIARRSECLWDIKTQTVYPNNQVYPAPSNMIRLHKVEFSPTSSDLTYPVLASNILNMDAVWGIQQNTPSSYPSFYSLWGSPPNVQIKLFPNPGAAGTINMFYYRIPATAVNDTDIIDIPEGWQDCIVLYCQYIAERKNASPMWKDIKQDYEAKLQDLINATYEYHDQANFVFTGGGFVPDFIWGGDW